MTDTEVLALFYQVFETANAVFTNWMAIITAMLVASYFFAPKISRKMAVLVLAVFSAFCLGYANALVNIYRDLAEIAAEMVRISMQEGSSLAWHPLVKSGSESPLSVAPNIMTGMSIFAYVSCLVFFFLSRRNNWAEPKIS